MTHYKNVSVEEMLLKLALDGNVRLFEALVSGMTPDEIDAACAQIAAYGSLADMQENTTFLLIYQVAKYGHVNMLELLHEVYGLGLAPLEEMKQQRNDQKVIYQKALADWKAMDEYVTAQQAHATATQTWLDEGQQGVQPRFKEPRKPRDLMLLEARQMGYSMGSVPYGNKPLAEWLEDLIAKATEENVRARVSLTRLEEADKQRREAAITERAMQIAGWQACRKYVLERETVLA